MPLTREHWKAGIALFFSFVIEAWEMMIIIMASGMIARDFQLREARLGSLMGSIYLGMIPGCLLWGKITDRIGRKKSMVASLATYGVISLASSFSPTYWILWGTRFVSGVALAGVLVSAFIYFEELLPVKIRGRATVYLASGWPLGMLLAIGVTHALRNTSWHWVLAASSLAGWWALVVWKWAPESPYWAAGKGEQALAKQGLEQLSQGRLKIDLAQVELVVEEYKQGSFLELFRRKLRVVTTLQSLLNFCFCWGYWALATWMPLLLAKKGLSVPEGNEFMALTALIMFPGYMSASWLTHRFGRKKIMVSFVSLAAIFGFLFAQSATLAQMYLWSFGLYFFNQGAWGVWDTWMGELYPTDVRGVGYSVGLTLQRVANALAPVVIGVLLARRASFAATVSFISAFLVATVILTLFLHETEGEVLR
ncbi:MAG: MFS transporter [Acidobacteriia bacterium]|nr:MFS transporter [Terriglobia bacterium]